MEMFIILLCAFLYAVKGGQIGWISRRIDGHIAAAIGFGLLCWGLHAGWGLLAGAFWFVAMKPSLGEQAGAIGGYRGNWDAQERTYPDRALAARIRKTGFKTGLQRGVFTGAMLAAGTGMIPLIYAGALFPVAYWTGISIEQFRTKNPVASWRWAEWIYGAMLGAGLAFAFNN